MPRKEVSFRSAVWERLKMWQARRFSWRRKMLPISTVCCYSWMAANWHEESAIMNRRDFLKRAAACGAGVPAWKSASAQIVRPATGPLRAHPQNPRYFTDGSGRAIFLTGAHTWANLQDTGVGPVPIFDWQAYLAMMQSHNHNFMRLWGWQQSAWAPWTPDKIL